MTITTSLDFSLPEKDGTSVSETSLALSPKHEPPKGKSKYFYTVFHTFSITQIVSVYEPGELSLCLKGPTWTTSSQVTGRSPLRQTRNSPRLAKVTFKTFTPPRVSSPLKEDQIKGD